MKGIILAGGLGQRLFPLTKVTNKHLLPVYNQPMIYYPIRTLVQSGIREILIISNREHISDFIELLSSGTDFQANFTYKIQEAPSGIGHALLLAEDFAKNEPFSLILGDNIFTDTFSEDVKKFTSGAKIFLKEVDEPKRFGIAEIAGDKVVSIEEKPMHPKSNLAVTGLYFYDAKAFEYLNTLPPSHRGEIEITDLNKKYLEAGTLQARVLHGLWTDAGTPDSLLEASLMLQKLNPETVFSADSKKAEKVVCGIVVHQSKDYDASQYFEPFFTSLLKQDYPNFEVWMLDNGSENKEALKVLKEKYKEIHFLESGKNSGFGAAHNAILKNTKSDYYLCLNFDILPEPDFISQLVKGIQSKSGIGAVCGKLKKWDFEHYKKAKETGSLHEEGKTNFIDSAGLRIRKSHRFEDRGQGEVDYGQYNEIQEIFGGSGAAVLYKRNALSSIAFTNDCGEKEYFDELFTMYKEDIDIAYRLQWLGWKALYIPKAIAYHDRKTASLGNTILQIIQNRRHKSAAISEQSFLNQEILLRKHFYARKFSRNIKWATRWYKLKSLMYILLFEPRLLSQYRNLSRISEQIEKRALRMPKTVSESHIETLMED